ncbi:MAG: 2Fe-2S iron-sulfur cluster binding domain-containing protein [Betaproteobacteria bacterium]|nr:2Fe-2S iron-sulfur cluster binding domain-containing protein [Betaproteobacteria bacterium]
MQKTPFALTVNGVRREVLAQPHYTLLGVLMDDLKLTGTKYGCGRGDCGACTVYLDGTPAQACQYTLAELGEREVTTIEGLSPERAFALYEAWAVEALKPCNRCQSGLIMRMAHLLARVAHPRADEIAASVKPYDCNCGAAAAMVAVVGRAAHALTA